MCVCSAVITLVQTENVKKKSVVVESSCLRYEFAKLFKSFVNLLQCYKSR